MKLTDALLGEHGVIYALFHHLDSELAGMKTLVEVKGAGAALTAALISHARIENDLLFPALDPHLGEAGPLAVMRHEHEEIDAALGEVASTSDHAVAVARIRHALEVARDHFAKEERVLFAMARQVLSNETLEELGARWAELRRVALG